MSIGIIRNLGNSAGGGTKVLKLYDNGKWNVDYDNAGYPPYAGWTNEGGFTLGTTQMTCNATGGNGRSRSITIALPIDLSPYKNLVVKYNNGLVVTLNVSSVNRTAYINTARWISGTTHYLGVSVSTQKSNFIDNKINDISAIPSISSGTLSIQEIYLTPLEKKFLYKDGVQNIAWDNSGTYKRMSGWVADGGATLNDNNMTLLYSVSPSHNRAIVTNSVVDFSQYSSLKIASVYSGSEHIKTINISAIQSSGYVIVQIHYYGSTEYFGVTLSANKDQYNATSNKILDSVDDIGTTNTHVTVSRVWLEK